MVRKPKLLSSIRAKLFSAVAMLLVAVIMVVSSTYAWFTLSTAPEVTGMTTAIGANGALEMALRYSDENGAVQDVREGVLTAGEDVNTYWGNLIALSGTDGVVNYGVDKITLLPSALNVSEGKIGSAMLKVPVYGPDGRVTNLAANTTSGMFDPDDGGNFYDSLGFGFRAIGVASGMSDRQLSYRSAKANASTAMGKAKNNAAASLNANGSVLANIAIKKGSQGNDAKYTKDEMQSLLNIVNDLRGTETTKGVLQFIDEAYMQYMLAYAAGEAGGTDNDVAWSAVKNAIEATDATVESVLTTLTAQNNVTVPEALSVPLQQYSATKTSVGEAYTILNGLVTGDKTEFVWSDFSGALTKLANVDAMKVNNIPAADIMNRVNDLMSSVTGGAGLTVSMATDGGVYADIADHCGDYNASITINKISYQGLELGPMDARMKTESTVKPAYLSVADSKVSSDSPEFAGASADSKPLTEFYGYVIDMAFRTNAAQSDLLLQTEATDRIYNDNANVETAGHGSTMTFASSSINFSDDQVKDLMSSMRVVFFTPGASVTAGGDVLAYAKLDMSEASLGSDGWTAPLRLYTVTVDSYTAYLNISTQTVDYLAKNDKYYAGTDTTFQTPIELPEGVNLEDGSVYNAVTHTGASTETMIGDTKDAVITALNQNQQVNVSALVYLDGESLTNADVAYDAATSMTGKVNFQFSSSATLVPMDNGVLHTPGAESESESTATQNP